MAAANAIVAAVTGGIDELPPFSSISSAVSSVPLINIAARTVVPNGAWSLLKESIANNNNIDMTAIAAEAGPFQADMDAIVAFVVKKSCALWLFNLNRSPIWLLFAMFFYAFIGSFVACLGKFYWKTLTGRRLSTGYNVLLCMASLAVWPIVGIALIVLACLRKFGHGSLKEGTRTKHKRRHPVSVTPKYTGDDSGGGSSDVVFVNE